MAPTYGSIFSGRAVSTMLKVGQCGVYWLILKAEPDVEPQARKGEALNWQDKKVPAMGAGPTHHLRRPS
jgi:hypothetical protein